MTDNEINKLLNIIEKDGLIKLKEYLEKEKKKNNSQYIQKTFEKYLTTNIGGYNGTTLPKLYEEKDRQIFTNGASIYIINSNLFKTRTKMLNNAKKGNISFPHRYKLAKLYEMEGYIERIEYLIGPNILRSIHLNKNITTTELKVEEHSFASYEINTCNILLNNPDYKILDKLPILEANSSIGKCYILGLQKNPIK